MWYLDAAFQGVDIKTFTELYGKAMQYAQPGDRLPRVQAGRRGRAAAGAVPLGERRGVPRLPVDIHHDRGVGVGP